MKWTRRKYRLKGKEPRIVKRFLIFPKTIEFETRWLETVKIEQSVVKQKGKYKWKSIKYKI